jgi:hypothetical protein
MLLTKPLFIPEILTGAPTVSPRTLSNRIVRGTCFENRFWTFPYVTIARAPNKKLIPTISPTRISDSFRLLLRFIATG